MKIFLTGFPGSGKTFLGSQAASLIDYPFVDTDNQIEKEEASTISSIFKDKGEGYFRETEARILRSFAKKRNAVIAVGGGLPCFHDNMEWMKSNGIVIYLEASAAFLFHRLRAEKKSRPLIAQLSDIELMIYITETIAGRREVYASADETLNAETCTAAKLASVIRKKIK